jgi:hypothetical protein
VESVATADDPVQDEECEVKKDRSIEEFIAALREVHANNPDLRVGQIICNSLHAQYCNDPYYVENDELVRGMRERLPKVPRSGK